MKFKIKLLLKQKGKGVFFGIFAFCLFMALNVYLAQAEEASKTTALLTPSDETTLLPPEAQIDYHNKRGKIFYDSREYAKAIEEFEQSLNIGPNNSFAAKYLILANQAKVKQDIEEKLKLKQKGEKLESNQISPPDTLTVGEKTTDSSPPKPKAKLSKERPIEYIISEGDMLDISVWEWSNLKTEVIVRPDGRISFPLVGDVDAAGMTLTQLDEIITERLSEFIRSPEVLVVFKTSGGKKVIILGQVATPGVYRISGRYTIMEAIALAGGYNNDAVLSNVVVIRGGPSNPKPMSLNLARVLKKGDLSQDIPLETEDIIYVPKTIISNVNYFVSQFTAPINQSIYTKKYVREWQKR